MAHNFSTEEARKVKKYVFRIEGYRKFEDFLAIKKFRSELG